VLFTFPSRYWFTIGRCSSLALEGGPPCFPQDFSCLVVLRIPLQATTTDLYGTLTRSGRAFQRVQVVIVLDIAVLQPRSLLQEAGLGYFPVRSPLLRESRLISFRRATEMFQFAHCPLPGLCVQPGVSRHHSGWVAPFGYIRLIAWMQLPLYVSPVSASFIGKQRQGIHLVLCVACSTALTSRGFCATRKLRLGFLLWFSVFFFVLVLHRALSKIEGISVQLEKYKAVKARSSSKKRHASRTMQPQPLESGNQAPSAVFRHEPPINALIIPVRPGNGGHCSPSRRAGPSYSLERR
jgi:hypothetical protein